MESLAKSDGVTLKQHTQDVRDEATQLLQARPMQGGGSFVARKYLQRTNHDLATLLDTAIRWHDTGKTHSQWQTACQRDFAEFEAWREAQGRERGERIVDFAQFRRAVRDNGRHIRKAGIRHEIASLALMKKYGVDLSLCGWAAVAAHHRKLGKRHEKRWSEHRDFWEMFLHESNQFPPHERASFAQVLAKRYEFDGPRAWLQLADGRASARESGDTLPELKPFEYDFPFKDEHGKRKPRGVQKLIENLWDEPFAILRAPTGSGKTDAALLWAQHQIENNLADRLVIAMPTRFTSNALAINITNTLSQRGLYHSTARFSEKKRQEKSATENDRIFDRDFFTKEMLLARLLETPVTVTTIDHLCIALTGAREDHHGIFWGLAHSCVVIDEADFYDDFTQRNMIVLLRALQVLAVPVLVMSATVPESARELYALSGFAPKKIYEDNSDIERERCRIHRQYENQPLRVQTPDDISALLCELTSKDAPLIIYANTVERAQAYRKWFEDNGTDENDEVIFDQDDIVLYHSRFCEPDKVVIEEKLTKLMGSEAWENGTARGVAILTQIGELSVNISADAMICDLCPIDRLTQRAGRLARFEKRADKLTNVIGDLYVVLPIRSGEEAEGEWYPAPYGRFAGGKWEMTDVLRQSNKWLVENKYSPRDFAALVDKLYPTLEAPTANAEENARQLENSFVSNWLIVQNAEAENEDNEETHIWKSRDIAPQQTVYADVKIPNLIDNNTPLLHPRNRMEFREWQLEHGIQIYSYQLKKAAEIGAVAEFTIIIGGETDDDREGKKRKEDEEKVWVVAEDRYNLIYGLRLQREVENYDDFE